MRKEFIISRLDEAQAIETLCELFKKKYPDVNAFNALVVMVSPDYSATVAMRLAHELSHDGEMCNILCIDVPYPDEDVETFIEKASGDIYKHLRFSGRKYQNIILVEAGVIRGSNYKWLTQLFAVILPTPTQILTTALYENAGSAFKSDVVVHYYDNDIQDLTFYYEKPNKHWA